MKRFTLWFAVAFVLFSFSGGFAKKELIPADLADLPDSVIKYDTYDPVSNPFERSLKGPVDYWVGVRFTVPPGKFGFTIGGIEFKVNNELLNTDDTAHLYLVEDTSISLGSYRPNFPNGVIESVAVVGPFNRLQGKPLLDSTEFGVADNFWIVLGPVPGGLDDSLPGHGWWASTDTLPADTITNYISFGNRNSWEKKRDTGNFVIRARGDFSAEPEVVINEVMFNADSSSSDPTRNHEWVEFYNGGSIQTIDADWKLHNENNATLTLPPRDFPSGSYLVVHINAPGYPTDTTIQTADRIDAYRSFPGEFFSNRKGACALNVGLVQHISYMGWNLKNLSLDNDSLSGSGILENLFISGGPTGARIRRAKRIQPTGGVGPLLTATAGISIGLDSTSNDSTADLDIDPEGPKSATFLGGPDAAGPTMGKQNLLPMVLDVSNQLPAPSDSAEWTIMLYVAGDYGNDTQRSPDRWYYDILNQIERVDSGGVDSVNVTVLYDTRRARLSSGPGTVSGTFEGELRWDATDTIRNLRYIPSSVNTGQAAVLANFLTQAMDSFPARHYVLALKGDGAGWEGLCGDAASGDRLEMGELDSALQAGLGSTKLDLLIFDAPLMSQLEVATQVKEFTHRMVASPEMIGPADFDYVRLVQDFRGGADTSGLINSLESILQSRTGEDPFAVWAIINLDNLEDSLVRLVDMLAMNLEEGVGDRCKPSDPSENYQIRIRNALTSFNTDHYGTQAQGMADFIDLRRFASYLKDNVPNTNCTPGHKVGADSVAAALRLDGPVIEGLKGKGATSGNYHEDAGGLSIYFPSARQRTTPIVKKNFRLRPYDKDTSDHPFDRPGLETEGGGFQSRHIYAADFTACYPHTGGSCTTGDSSAAQNYPYPPVANFDFVNNKHWDEFLIRYYKPAADVGIEFDELDLKQSFIVDASGTSDPDSPYLRYFWDFSATADTISDCGLVFKDDLDKDCEDETTDEADREDKVVTHEGYSVPGDHAIWLHVWDDYDSSLTGTFRGFQTDKDSTVRQIKFRGVQYALEDVSLNAIYKDSCLDLIPDQLLPAKLLRDLNLPGSRTGMALNYFINLANVAPHIIWSTGPVTSPDSIFPFACQRELNSSLGFDDMGAWICAPRIGGDIASKTYFDTTFGFVLSGAGINAYAQLQPVTGSQHFLSGLGTLDLRGGTQLQKLANVRPPAFPLLVTTTRDTVAAARVEAEGSRAIIFSTFGLEHLADTAQIHKLLEEVLGWLAAPESPGPPPLPPCTLSVRPKGDFNCDSMVGPPDVVSALNCAYLGTGVCDTSFGDVTCDGQITGADVAQLLKMAYLADSLGPACYPSVFRTGAVTDELDKNLLLDSPVGLESEFEGIFKRKRR